MQHCFRTKLEAEAFHPSDQTSLPVPHIDEQFGNALMVPAEARPALLLVDIGFYSPHHVRRMYALFAASTRVISALYAAIVPPLRRMPGSRTREPSS